MPRLTASVGRLEALRQLAPGLFAVDLVPPGSRPAARHRGCVDGERLRVDRDPPGRARDGRGSLDARARASSCASPTGRSDRPSPTRTASRTSRWSSLPACTSPITASGRFPLLSRPFAAARRARRHLRAGRRRRGRAGPCLRDHRGRRAVVPAPVAVTTSTGEVPPLAEVAPGELVGRWHLPAGLARDETLAAGVEGSRPEAESRLLALPRSRGEHRDLAGAAAGTRRRRRGAGQRPHPDGAGNPVDADVELQRINPASHLRHPGGRGRGPLLGPPSRPTRAAAIASRSRRRPAAPARFSAIRSSRARRRASPARWTPHRSGPTAAARASSTSGCSTRAESRCPPRPPSSRGPTWSRRSSPSAPGSTSSPTIRRGAPTTPPRRCASTRPGRPRRPQVRLVGARPRLEVSPELGVAIVSAAHLARAVPSGRRLDASLRPGPRARARGGLEPPVRALARGRGRPGPQRPGSLRVAARARRVALGHVAADAALGQRRCRRRAREQLHERRRSALLHRGGVGARGGGVRSPGASACGDGSRSSSWAPAGREILICRASAARCCPSRSPRGTALKCSDPGRRCARSRRSIALLAACSESRASMAPRPQSIEPAVAYGSVPTAVVDPR